MIVTNPLPSQVYEITGPYESNTFKTLWIKNSVLNPLPSKM